MSAGIGEAFVAALAAKDPDRLRAVLDPAIDVRALTPNQFWEASSADDFIARIVLGDWFEPTDEITGVTRIETGDVVGPRHRVGYRLTVTNPDGDHVVEQQAFYESDGDRITWLRIMCAGFLPVA